MRRLRLLADAFPCAFDEGAEGFLELWVVYGKDRAAAQLPDEAAKPDRAEREQLGAEAVAAVLSGLF